jgi:hypothetical protein
MRSEVLIVLSKPAQTLGREGDHKGTGWTPRRGSSTYFFGAAAGDAPQACGGVPQTSTR